MTRSLPRRTYLYFAAQSINLTTAVMSVTMAAIVGTALAPSEPWATVPYGCQFLLMMLATYPVSRLMARIGRKRSFMLGALPLAVAGMCGYWAVEHRQFALLVVSHAALGIYIAFANFNRFAATDRLEPGLKPKAISLVVAGGVIAAVIGPALTEWLREVAGFALFSLCYAAFIGLALLSWFIATCLSSDPLTPSAGEKKTAVPAALALHPTQRQAMVLAMAVAALGYAIMNLLMIQASMHMGHQHEDFSHVRLAIQWRVIAMFAPSFFTGALIQRFGTKATLCAGLALLIACTAINLAANSYATMTFSLIVLGLGWNLTYVGGGALLAETLEQHSQAFQMQGRNDLAIAVCATLGAFSPALALNTLGWSGSNILCMGLGIALLLATAAGLKPAPATPQVRPST